MLKNFDFLVLFIPFAHRVSGCFLLQSFKNGLVFYCYLHEVLLAFVSIQTAYLETLYINAHDEMSNGCSEIYLDCKVWVSGPT